MRRVDDQVLGVLRQIECEGNAARITAQLERGLYVATDKVLKALGGDWNRKAKAHLPSKGQPTGESRNCSSTQSTFLRSQRNTQQTE